MQYENKYINLPVKIQCCTLCKKDVKIKARCETCGKYLYPCCGATKEFIEKAHEIWCNVGSGMIDPDTGERL